MESKELFEIIWNYLKIFYVCNFETTRKDNVIQFGSLFYNNYIILEDNEIAYYFRMNENRIQIHNIEDAWRIIRRNSDELDYTMPLDVAYYSNFIKTCKKDYSK